MKIHGNHQFNAANQIASYVTDTGTVDAYAVTLRPAPSAYTTGLLIRFKAISANTGACTLDVNTLGAIALKKNVSQDLANGDILAGQVVEAVYDGTNFQTVTSIGLSIPSISSFRIDGGEIVWVVNYDYLVSAANYVILGTQYSSPETTITLSAADATFDRFDLVVVDTSGSVQVITGTPSGDPQQPSYDPATQLPLAFILVTANTTQPVCASLVKVYAENTGTPTEWAAVSSSGTINVNSSNNPRTGTKDIEITAGTVNATVTFTPIAGVNFDNVTQIDLYIRSKAGWGNVNNGKKIAVSLYTSAGQVGSTVLITSSGSFGFNSSTTGVYQQIGIAKTLFGIVTGTVITSMVFTIIGPQGTIGCYIDDISLEQNCLISPPSDVLTFNNALTRTNNNVQLGGTLIKNTTVDFDFFALNFSDVGVFEDLIQDFFSQR
mgnify:CR=1 FL=1